MTSTQKTVLTILAAKNAIQSNKLLVLERQDFLHNSTKGQLLVNHKSFHTLELSWKDNQQNISCIPAGTYTFQKIQRTSNKQPALYLRDVTNRTEILIHQGNKPSHTQGCILIDNYEEFHHNVATKGLIVII